MDPLREAAARNSANILLGRSGSNTGATTPLSHLHHSIESPVFSSSGMDYASDEAGHRWCGVMTASRRTFCLLVTFDFIMMFILWGVYVKIESTNENKTLIEMLNEEVAQFNFQKSLFDIMMCAVFRFLSLTLGYAIFRIRNPSVIAVTTFVTCAWVVVKVFLMLNKAHPVSYVVLVTSFVIVWIETWFLDFKVLPQEQLYREMFERVQAMRQMEREEERRHLLEEDELQFHTPENWSPNVSHQSPRQNYGTILSQRDQELRQQAEDAWRQAHRLFTIDEGWKCDSTYYPDAEKIVVYSQRMERYGRLLKVESVVNASPTTVFEETVLNCQSSPSWNPTILEYRIIHAIDACTDVAYNVTAPAGGGVVSSRDFVTLRHWKKSDDDVLLSSGIAVEHPSMPPTKIHVRGENRLAGWEFRPVPNLPNRCLLRMIVSTDIKGWIPQRVVDQALTGVLVDFVRYLHARVQAISPAV